MAVIQELSSPIVQSGFAQYLSYLTQISRGEQICLRIQLRPAHDTKHLLIGRRLHLWGEWGKSGSPACVFFILNKNR